MNRQGITPAGRYKGVDYFNGGLFLEIHAIELEREELIILDSAARENWGKIRPAIFGSIFEATSDSTERHARGMHFTSEVDIMKIVVPKITRYWEEKIEAANTIAALNALQLELQGYRVLDPACGSGNFLYLAYQELKRIEVMLLAKLASKQKSSQVQMGLVTPNQFFGMDINPFAVELARVTLMIARKVAIDNHSLSEPALPLDILDHNIVCQDALFTEWEKADAIVGNPPFLGGYRIRQELGDKYAEKVFGKFSDVKDQVDISSYWFRLAHDSLDHKGRAGLVATNTICQGKSRRASLDYIVQDAGFIHEAISSQPWSGEAAVYVSIVNWCYEKPKKVYLNGETILSTNSSLNANTDVISASRIKTNLNLCFQGVMPTGKGFIVSQAECQAWIKAQSKNQEIVKSFLDAADLTKSPNGTPTRYIIDFNNRSIEEVSDYKLPFQHIKNIVKPERDNNREQILREKWWRFKRTHEALRKAIAPLSIYFAVPAHSKWFVFLPCESSWLPNNSVKVVASDDFYILGILTSKVHRFWIKAQSSSLGETTRYTHNTCFETFPFPQNKTSPLTDKIRFTMQELHQYRTEQMESKQWGITKLYNEYFHEPASQLYKLHAKLDKQVMQIYGFSEDDDLLEKLLHLNQEIAAKESS
jgi:type II restriction/modification system DNA methylase subunit YeeA